MNEYHCTITSLSIQFVDAAAVAQSVRAFGPQSEGLEFESQQRQTQVVKTGSDRCTAECSAVDVSVTGPRR